MMSLLQTMALMSGLILVTAVVTWERKPTLVLAPTQPRSPDIPASAATGGKLP